MGSCQTENCIFKIVARLCVWTRAQCAHWTFVEDLWGKKLFWGHWSSFQKMFLFTNLSNAVQRPMQCNVQLQRGERRRNWKCVRSSQPTKLIPCKVGKVQFHQFVQLQQKRELENVCGTQPTNLIKVARLEKSNQSSSEVRKCFVFKLDSFNPDP